MHLVSPVSTSVHLSICWYVCQGQRSTPKVKLKCLACSGQYLACRMEQQAITLKFGVKNDCYQSKEFVCVCDHGAYADNYADVIDLLLINTYVQKNSKYIFQNTTSNKQCVGSSCPSYRCWPKGRFSLLLCTYPVSSSGSPADGMSYTVHSLLSGRIVIRGHRTNSSVEKNT